MCWFSLAPPAYWRIAVEKERGGRTCRVCRRRRRRYRRPLGVTPPPPPPNGSVSPVAGRPCCDDETPAAVECVSRRRRRRGHCRVVGSDRQRRRYVVAGHGAPIGVYRLLRIVPGRRSVRVLGHRGTGRGGPCQGAQGASARVPRRSHVCPRYV